MQKDLQSKEDKILNTAKDTITKIAKDFEKHEKKIGEELVSANTEYIQQQRIENILTQCPLCKKGNLAIKYSKKTRRSFVACDKYPDCTNTYSLPPNLIKKADKICESCGFPMLMSLKKGKRPWIFCFNKNCESNKKRLEEYYKRKEEEKAEGKTEEKED